MAIGIEAKNPLQENEAGFLFYALTKHLNPPFLTSQFLQ